MKRPMWVRGVDLGPEGTSVVTGALRVGENPQESLQCGENVGAECHHLRASAGEMPRKAAQEKQPREQEESQGAGGEGQGQRRFSEAGRGRQRPGK